MKKKTRKRKIYCKNCKHLMSFTRFYCYMVDIANGLDMKYLNKNLNCEFYETSAWRFWVRD